MPLTLWIAIGSALLSAILGFGAGYKLSQLKEGNEDKKAALQEAAAYQAQSQELLAHLNLTVAKANAAADKTQASLDAIDATISAKNKSLAALSKQTRELQNEISQLDINCVVPTEYQRVQAETSEAANSNRSKLYGGD